MKRIRARSALGVVFLLLLQALGAAFVATPAQAVTDHEYTVDCLQTYAQNGDRNISIAQGDTIKFRTLYAAGSTGVCDSLYYGGDVTSTAFSSLPGLMWQGSDTNMNITVSPTAPLGGSYRFAVYTSTLSGGSNNGTAFFVTVIAGALAAPQSPTGASATSGNGQATVSWTPPSSGETPSSYTVTSSPGALECEVAHPATSCNVTGLTNGVAYTFTVVAANGGGNSSPSSASNSVTPLAPPGAPFGVQAVPGNGQATVSWTNGSPRAAPSSYTVTSSPGALTCSATHPATTCDVAGLTNGVAYTFTVVAVNGGGNSSPSSASNSVTPLAPPPGAASGVQAVPGNGQATVSWTAPSSGATPSSYTVTSSPGALTCTATHPTTTCNVTGLTNGVAYTFTVVSKNGSGDSIASAESPQVSPSAAASSGEPSGSGTPSLPLAMTGMSAGLITAIVLAGLLFVFFGSSSFSIKGRLRLAGVNQMTVEKLSRAHELLSSMEERHRQHVIRSRMKTPR